MKTSGIVYIFSHDDFGEGYDGREGRVVDEERIKSHFSETFDFEVCDPYVNLTREQVLTEAINAGEKIKYSTVDIAIIFVISKFDTLGHYFTKDFDISQNDIIECFTSARSDCRPLIFIFQASKATLKNKEPSNIDCGDFLVKSCTAPQQANIYIVQSILPYLTNHEPRGTWFIDEFCNNFNGEYSLQYEMVNILEIAHNKINENYSEAVSQYIYTPDVTSTLLKNVLLKSETANNPESLDSYNNQKPGCVLIYNYTNSYNPDKLEDEGNRIGADIDVKILKEQFEKLNFQVKVKYDLPRHELIGDYETELKKSKQFSCVVVVMLSHGIDGRLGTKTEPLDIKEFFRIAQEEKALKGKPKIFILQMCRGKKSAKTVETAHNSTESTNNIVSKIHFKYDDTIVLHSTCEDHVAHRETDGSWLIKALCNEIKAVLYKPGGREVSLIDLFTETQNRVSKRDDRGWKQMPVYTSTLTKNVIFVSKPGSDDTEIPDWIAYSIIIGLVVTLYTIYTWLVHFIQ